jgi:hypothetical protein
MSGPIGTSQIETGTRGLWLEKRNALVADLSRRGHQVDYINRMTKFSQQLFEPEFGPKTHDLLMLEFGSSNAVFYKDDLAKTECMVEEHKGEIVFICDDPDLPYRWKTLKSTNRWSVWMNAFRPQAFGGQPKEIKCFDTPFASLLEYRLPLTKYGDRFVYLGRPGGRRAAVEKVIASGVRWTVYGRQAEWKQFQVAVKPSPTQAQRSAFYSGQLGCIVLADAKHKRLGWRTGRGYHALYAGCPVIREAEHDALRAFTPFETAHDLVRIQAYWMNPVTRATIVSDQLSVAMKDREILEATYKAHGL